MGNEAVTDSNPQPGDIYEKRATSKTSVNAPRIRFEFGYGNSAGGIVTPVNFRTGHGWKEFHWQKHGGRRFIKNINRDWFKVGE
jgi:hypothetical protein